MIYKFLYCLFCAWLSAATLQVRSGLLDRLVQHYKEDLMDDLVRVAPVNIHVKVKRAPRGYVDSPHWNYESVMRLIGLIRESEKTIPRPLLKRLLAEIDAPSRRYMGMGNLHQMRVRAQKRKALIRRCLGSSGKSGYPRHCPKNMERFRKKQEQLRMKKYPKMKDKFVDTRKQINRWYVPSLGNPNDIYYDDMLSVEAPSTVVFSQEYNSSNHDDDIVVIVNPVEAKLPSGLISIKMLRHILEERAMAGRVMPSRETTTRSFVTLAQLNGNTTDAGCGNDTTADGDGGATAMEGGEGGTATGDEGTGTAGEGGGTDAEATEEAPAADKR